MDKPIWVERILSDTQSYLSFMEFIDHREASLMRKMHEEISENQMEKARVHAGEAKAFQALRHQIKMYEREEEQHGIIQQEQAR